MLQSMMSSAVESGSASGRYEVGRLLALQVVSKVIACLWEEGILMTLAILRQCLNPSTELGRMVLGATLSSPRTSLDNVVLTMQAAADRIFEQDSGIVDHPKIHWLIDEILRSVSAFAGCNEMTTRRCRYLVVCAASVTAAAVHSALSQRRISSNVVEDSWSSYDSRCAIVTLCTSRDLPVDNDRVSESAFLFDTIVFYSARAVEMNLQSYRSIVHRKCFEISRVYVLETSPRGGPIARHGVRSRLVATLSNQHNLPASEHGDDTVLSIETGSIDALGFDFGVCCQPPYRVPCEIGLGLTVLEGRGANSCANPLTTKVTFAGVDILVNTATVSEEFTASDIVNMCDFADDVVVVKQHMQKNCNIVISSTTCVSVLACRDTLREDAEDVVTDLCLSFDTIWIIVELLEDINSMDALYTLLANIIHFPGTSIYVRYSFSEAATTDLVVSIARHSAMASSKNGSAENKRLLQEGQGGAMMGELCDSNRWDARFNTFLCSLPCWNEGISAAVAAQGVTCKQVIA